MVKAPELEPYVIPLTLGLLSSRLVYRPAPRHRSGRQFLRSDHHRVVCDDRAARPHRDRPQSRNHQGGEPVLRGQLRDRRARDRASPSSAPAVLAVTGARRRSTPIWAISAASADPPRLVAVCSFPALLLNYFGQGALLLAHPETVVNPFYHLRAGLGRVSAGGSGLDGDRDRVPGRHLRRLLAGAAGRAARLPAAHAGPPHLRGRGGPSLRTRDQQSAAGRGRRHGARVPLVGCAGLGLRHRRDRNLHRRRYDARLHVSRCWARAGRGGGCCRCSGCSSPSICLSSAPIC